MGSKAVSVALLTALACGGLRAREPVSVRETVVGVAPLDSLIDNGVVYRGRMSIVTVAGEPMLEVRVDLRSLRPDTLTVESEAGGCNPPLYLRPASRGRWIAWSDAAWQHGRGVICIGTGLLVTMTAGGRGSLEPRTYPVRAVRGDSLPPGPYDGVVGIRIERAMTSAESIPRWHTLQVPAGRVTLP